WLCPPSAANTARPYRHPLDHGRSPDHRLYTVGPRNGVEPAAARYPSTDCRDAGAANRRYAASVKVPETPSASADGAIQTRNPPGS
ncbi:hypothetical protein, partial [Salmonella sp. M9-3]|uniref:hypothetical protein n=1 Tax=Salmonella sp. M9-3 TaxID=3240318 RepID=UPI00352A0A47